MISTFPSCTHFNKRVTSLKQEVCAFGQTPFSPITWVYTLWMPPITNFYSSIGIYVIFEFQFWFDYETPTLFYGWFPAGNYMFNFNSRNTKKRCEICLKLAIKTPERRSIVNFEQVNADWVMGCGLWAFILTHFLSMHCLKTSESLRFLDVFRRYPKKTLA